MNQPLRTSGDYKREPRQVRARSKAPVRGWLGLSPGEGVVQRWFVPVLLAVLVALVGERGLAQSAGGRQRPIKTDAMQPSVASASEQAGPPSEGKQAEGQGGDETRPPACPLAARQVELACQSWTEIDAALKNAPMTALLPVGGTEQSGPYMAVGKHDVRARVLADEIARKLGHTLVAPVLAYVPEGGTSPRSGHMRFAGTLSIPPAVFAGLVEGAAESLRAQGFATVVLLGDHGGYQAQLAGLAHKLGQRWALEGSRTRILYVGAYYDVVAGRYRDYLRGQGQGVALGKHADISDTSLMLAVDPSLVREGLLRQAAKLNSADGVYGGDPRQATAELGQVGTAMQVQASVEAISSFNRRHP